MKDFFKTPQQAKEAWHKKLILCFTCTLILSVCIIILCYYIAYLSNKLPNLYNDPFLWFGIIAFSISWILLTLIWLDKKNRHASCKKNSMPDSHSNNKNKTTKRDNIPKDFVRKHFLEMLRLQKEDLRRKMREQK